MNKEQKEAVEYIDGPLLVIAGAGTGKTYTINEKVKYLIEKGFDPKRILLLTFTKDAANEMKERIGNDDIWAGTFHSFCVRLIRKYCGEIKMKRNFTIISGDDVEEAISIAMDGTGINLDPHKVMSAISASINKEKTFSELYGEGDTAKSLKKVADNYKRFKILHNMLDFDDLLVYALTLLDIPSVRKAVESSYDYVCVDEFQDTNPLQERIVFAIRKNDRRLMVVGDDAQSIYAFRGAEVKNILTFAERTGAKTVKLVRNYRSTQPILSFSNTVMETCYDGIKKNLVSDKGGKPPIVRTVGNTQAEAAYVIKAIKVLHDHDRYSIAVLARTGAEMNEVEGRLIAEGIPYVKKGGTALTERNFVKDFQAFFKVAFNDDDELAKVRLLRMIPGIGPKTALQIAEGRKSHPEADAMMMCIEMIRSCPESGDKTALDSYEKFAKMKEDARAKKAKTDPDYTEITKNMETLKAIASSYSGDLESYLDETMDFSSDDNDDKNCVVLSTVHSAKGLEYDTVFILNCVEGVFPFKGEVQESLRCFYVGITRAKINLVMICPKTIYNAKFHKLIRKEDSRFINSALEDVRCI